MVDKMIGLIKARIASVAGKTIGLELPDGKMLHANDPGGMCSPAMVDTVRCVMLKTYVWDVEKLKEPIYCIDVNHVEKLEEYVYYGQVIHVQDKIILLETGHGMLATFHVGHRPGSLAAGDHIKACGNNNVLKLLNISGDNGRMVIE
jgi:hypothetical protein